MTDAVVNFVNVNKSYDGTSLVVDDLNLTVHRGEFLTLLGSSGSGKTSSLMMLAGFESPTSGEIFIDGKPITHVPAYKRNVGVVFQNYALFPHMAVAKNLSFPLEARGMAKGEIRQRVARMLDMIQLPGYAERRINQLSGGQQQRIALARALIFDPAVVLMDEPLGALDRQLREAMQYEIKRIHKTLGLTIVYVTHDQDEAITMSDRVAVLEKGKVEQIGAPSDLYERPMTAFVAQFVGENNCLHGTVNAIDGNFCQIGTDGGPVRAVAVNIDPQAKTAMLAIRPERIVLNPQSGGVENCFPCTVRELTYRGDHLCARLSIGGRQELSVKVPNDRDAVPIEIGQSLTAGWRAEDCRALAVS